MLRFYPYYTKNHPFLISKTVFKINNSMIYYLITMYLSVFDSECPYSSLSH